MVVTILLGLFAAALTSLEVNRPPPSQRNALSGCLADAALYRAEAEGRDRVATAG